MIALLLSLTLAAAAETQELVWDISLNGRPVGYRTATLKWLDAPDGGSRRVVEMWTEVDATIIGVDYRYRQRLTADATDGPSSFHVVSDLNGDITEVQGRRGGGRWKLTVGYNRRSATLEKDLTAIDLSTADLVDPASEVPLWRFDQVNILSVENGSVYPSPITRLGDGTVQIAGQPVAVVGYGWSADLGKGKLWYDPAGYLVQYESSVLGYRLVGTLRSLPPNIPGEAPVVLDAGVSEIPVER